jgi:nucleotide-binding universal stress UspA family protein
VPYDRLLVAIDFSRESLAALASVRELAQRVGGELVLLHVSEAADVVPGSDLAKHDRAKWQTELDAEVAQLRAAGLRARALIRPGYPVAEEIVEAARQEKADLIVVGSPGRSRLAERLLGGVTDTVIGTAPCPVLVMSRSLPDAG